jgi:hypothetical protein
MSQTFWKLSVVLFLLLLVAPGAALAEEAAPQEDPFQRTELPASLHLLEDLEEPAVTRPTENPALRMLLALGGAALTSSLTAAGGYHLGRAICSDALLCTEPFFGVLMGVSLGSALGTWWGGALAGGRGSFWSAMVGASAGMMATAIVFRGLLFFIRPQNPFAPVGYAGSYAILSLCTMAGAVTGYEIAHRLTAPAEATAPEPALQPLVAVTSGGAALGLGGRF